MLSGRNGAGCVIQREQRLPLVVAVVDYTVGLELEACGLRSRAYPRPGKFAVNRGDILTPTATSTAAQKASSSRHFSKAA